MDVSFKTNSNKKSAKIIAITTKSTRFEMLVNAVIDNTILLEC